MFFESSPVFVSDFKGRGMKKDEQKMELLFAVFSITALILSAESSTINPKCSARCGSVQIHYPFGIGSECYLDGGFAVSCNKSRDDSAPKLFAKSIDMEILEIFPDRSRVRVKNPVVFSNCGKKNNTETLIDLVSSPFSLSAEDNQFIAMGCNNLALLSDKRQTYGGCLSICLDVVGLNPSSTNGTKAGSCNGINCCKASIPPFLNYIGVSMKGINATREDRNSSCRYGFVVEKEQFDESYVDPNITDFVPAMLLWGVGVENCTSFSNNTRLCGKNARCLSVVGIYGDVCECEDGYAGNPYLPHGCQEIDFCSRERNHCSDGICRSQPSGPYCIPCPDGYTFRNNYCYPHGARRGMVVIGCSVGFGGIFLVIFSWWLYRLLRRRRITKQKQTFFKRNGGLLLQQFSSTEAGFEKSRIFSEEELLKATDHYNENRILGKGGQGTVFKGMMTDGRIVAVKKSKIENSSLIQQFINEVVILSQINHRNVVKLLGFCLESEVPLLVYEFIPNGTLFHLLHDANDDFPFTWDMRLRVAVEVASALSYLHSAASIPIYHRDIKSTNILLDEKYVAKVSDFGASKSVAVDQTHMTTKVQGTFGYLDPEYFQSNQFTEKSDVYSFGVVLIELLTGQKPISATRSEEKQNLAALFLALMKEDRVNEILDARITKNGKKETISAVAKLAKRCLNLNGKKRPTMKEVAAELERIRSESCMQEARENDDQTAPEVEGEYGADEIAMAGQEIWPTSISTHSDAHADFASTGQDDHGQESSLLCSSYKLCYVMLCSNLK